MKSGIKPKMLLPFDYNLSILVIEHAYMVCPGTFIVLFWKLKGTSVYWPWSKGIHSSKAKSPNWQWLPTSKTIFLGFVGSLGTKTIDFWFARAIPWPTTRPTVHCFWKNYRVKYVHCQVILGAVSGRRQEQLMQILIVRFWKKHLILFP